MIRSLCTTLLLLAFTPLFAKETDQRGKSLPAYSITSVKADKTLQTNEALFIFSCEYTSKAPVTASIKYSYNGKQETVKTDANGKFSLKVNPGKYKFQFFLNGNYEEIYTDSIPAKSKTRTEIKLTFKDALMYMIEDKPVIYLYPQQETTVSVKLDLKGEMLFTYPAYQNGWTVKASPDGTLEQNGKMYSYLFWEGKTEIAKKDIPMLEGFIVNKTDLLSFFEEKLSKMGLSSKEQQDFITYWIPRMASSEKNYIHFLCNDDFDSYAHLNITPKPDNIFRVFMLWDPVSAEQEIKVTPQKLPSANRSGFTVIEWGGSEVNYFNSENN